ncbi:unnamed protein product, partial [Ectocarpus sp. 12 AP-2014]
SSNEANSLPTETPYADHSSVGWHRWRLQFDGTCSRRLAFSREERQAQSVAGDMRGRVAIQTRKFNPRPHAPTRFKARVCGDRRTRGSGEELLRNPCCIGHLQNWACRNPHQ